jgi:hypothetical protein
MAMSALLMLVASSLLILSGQEKVHANDSLDALLARTIIVNARVIEVEGTAQRSTATQRIEYIYSGNLPGGVTTFIDSSAGATTTGGAVFPALKLDQQGIWLLWPHSDGQVYRSRGNLGVNWPSRFGIDPRYDQVLMLAEAVETVWRAKAQAERLELLKEFARSEVPEVGVGAIMLLEQGAPDALRNLVTEIDLSVLTVRAQIAFDEAMTRLTDNQWRKSEGRQQLLAQWRMRAMNDEDDLLHVLRRLDQAIQGNEIESDELYAFLRPIITSDLRMVVKGEPHSRDVRIRANSMLRWIANEPTLRDDVFNLMANLLEGGEDDRLKRSAAWNLQTFTTLKRDQIEYLKELRDHYVDLAAASDERHAPVKQIAAILEETIQSLSADDG